MDDVIEDFAAVIENPLSYRHFFFMCDESASLFRRELAVTIGHSLVAFRQFDRQRRFLNLTPSGN